MKAVILAAGKGTRMMPLTKTRPKVMMPVLNAPVLEHIIKGIRDAGISEFLLITGYLGDQIREHLRDGSQYGVAIDYLSQPADPDARYGTAVAVALARDFVGKQPFLLMFGDIMTPNENYQRLTRAYEADKDACWLSVNSTRDVSTGGAVFVENGVVVDIVEKPPAGTVSTKYINAGVFILKPNIFDAIEGLECSARGEYELPSAVTRLINDGVRFNAHELIGYWSNLSSPTEFMSLNYLLMQKMAASFYDLCPELGLRVAKGDNCHGLVCLGEDTRVSPGAEVIGPVVIGNNCEIGDARISRYTCIGSDCVVADGSSLVWTTVFNQTTIGQNARVANAILGSGVHIGEGAMCLGTSDDAVVVADDHVVAPA